MPEGLLDSWIQWENYAQPEGATLLRITPTAAKVHNFVLLSENLIKSIHSCQFRIFHTCTFLVLVSDHADYRYKSCLSRYLSYLLSHRTIPIGMWNLSVSRLWSYSWFLALKTEAIHSSETLVYNTALCYSPEDHNRHSSWLATLCIPDKSVFYRDCNRPFWLR